MNMTHPLSVLFVCTGNICRSPTAEGLFRDRISKAGVSDRFIVDSAGTGNWHVGNPPDPRSVATALSRGVDISVLRARQLKPEDYTSFHYLIAMDESHLIHMQKYKPASSGAELSLLMNYAGMQKWTDVPDPYYGGQEDFDLAYDLIKAGIDGLFETLHKRQGG